ncbi:MAG: hypothetical protein L6R36_001235 [Xanthoria steineri]|nr:MAG: hypothetical protein L6R36_001235 [Xanthoria steineri]
MVRRQKKKPVQISGAKDLHQENGLASSRLPSSPPETRSISGPVKKDKMSSNASNPYDSTTRDPRPRKRLKTNAGLAIPSASTTDSSATQALDPSASSTQADSAPSLPSIPTEIQHLQGQYDISTISIVSSSKIRTKVNNLIARVEKFTFANVSAKPGVVVLQAKAASANKMISVVEIAKEDIGKRGGKWYEYSKLHSELLEYREKQRRRPQDGRTLAEVSSGRSTMEDEGAEKHGTDGGVDGEDDLVHDGGCDSDEEAAFETLQQPNVGAGVNGKSKVRATPIMTIYLACVPVPGLKDLHG